MDFIQPNKRMINWGAILSGICLIAICFSIALCSLNDSSQTEGQITAMRYQENAVAANELLTQAFERDSNGAIIFPEDYAGAYIDGENLVLLLTNTDSKTVEKRIRIRLVPAIVSPIHIPLMELFHLRLLTPS